MPIAIHIQHHETGARNPCEAREWPESKLRQIFIHELEHIRRNDFLILSLSRFICSVLWFIPVLWIVHAYLKLEQEEICDALVVEEGARPTAYARSLIDLARTARSLVLWSGIFIMKRRNTMLEKRVTSVLNMKHTRVGERAGRRKLRFLSVFTLVIAVLAITLSYAAEKTLISPDIAMKQFTGVYVNTEYVLYS